MILSLPDITMQQLLQRIVAYLVVAAVYGLTVAWVSKRAGDPGPSYDGRLTPNPLVHLDIVALLGAIFFRVGWIKPLDVDVSAFKTPRLGAAAVLLVSTSIMIGVAFMWLSLRPLVLTVFGADSGLLVAGLLGVAFELTIATVLLNLLPLPPLLGSLWWSVVLPGRDGWARRYQTRLIGTIVIVAALVSGVVTPPLRASVEWFRFVFGF